MNKSDNGYPDSEQMFSPIVARALSCPSISQKVTSTLRETGQQSSHWPPHGPQTGQTGTFLAYLESWQVPAFPSEQTEKPGHVSTHQSPEQPGDRLSPSGLLPLYDFLQVRDSAGSPDRHWVWLARFIYTQKRVPRSPECSTWVPGSLLGGLLPHQADPGELPGSAGRRAEMVMTVATGALNVHDSALTTVLPALGYSDCLLA